MVYKLISGGKLKAKDVLVYLSVTQDSKDFDKSERSISIDTRLSRQYVHASIKRLEICQLILPTQVRRKDTIIDNGDEIDMWNPYFHFENLVPFWDKAKNAGEKFRFVPKYLLLLPSTAQMCTSVYADIHSRQPNFISALRPIDLAVFVFLLSRHPDRYFMNVTRDAARCGVAINTFKKSVKLLKDLHLISINRDTMRVQAHIDHARTFVRVKDKLQEAALPAVAVEPLSAESVNFLRKDIEYCESKEDFEEIKKRIWTHSDKKQLDHENVIELFEDINMHMDALGLATPSS